MERRSFLLVALALIGCRTSRDLPMESNPSPSPPLRCSKCGRANSTVRERAPCLQHFSSAVYCDACDPQTEYEDCSGQPHDNALHR